MGLLSSLLPVQEQLHLEKKELHQRKWIVISGVDIASNIMEIYFSSGFAATLLVIFRMSVINCGKHSRICNF